MTKRLLASLALLAALAVSPSSLRASEILMDWGTGAHNITDDSDIYTEGTQVLGYYFNSTPSDDRPSARGPGLNASIGGVNFEAVSLTVTTPNFNYNTTTTFQAGGVYAYENLGSGSAPFSAVSLDYQTILSGGISSAASDTMTLTLSGLTVGQLYVFQFWTSNSALFLNNGTERFNTTATGTTSISLNDNLGDAQGALGQYAIGTFIATDTDQSLTFQGINGTNDALINAFQLRAVDVVPEPSISVLLGLGLLCGSFFIRRNRRAA